MGQRFQAEIPPTRNLLLMLYDEHPAQPVWAPWGDTSTNADTQKRGEAGPRAQIPLLSHTHPRSDCEIVFIR